jgi:DNA-binding CsgD family transcriptional regulator
MVGYLQHWAESHAVPLLLITPDLTVLWCNDAAQSFRDRWPNIGVDAGRLFLAERTRTTALRDRLATIETKAVAWVCEISGARFIFKIEPVRPEGRDAAFLVTIQPMDETDRYLWADMAAAFGLTASENRVVRLLISGLSVEALARDLSISIETVRTHVRRVYAKLGVNGREQMFSVVLPYRLG